MFSKSYAVFAVALTIALAGCATSQPNPEIAIGWPSHAPSEKQSAVWLGYLMARANYVGHHKEMYAAVSGICIPRFAEEVDARDKAAGIYSEMSATDKQFHDGYFEDLLKVRKAGFMKEYVWSYLIRPTWAESEKPSKLVAFNSWKEINLPNHKAVTYGSISIRQK